LQSEPGFVRKKRVFRPGCLPAPGRCSARLGQGAVGVHVQGRSRFPGYVSGRQRAPFS